MEHTLSSWLKDFDRFQTVCTCGRMSEHQPTLKRAVNDQQLHEQTANRDTFTRTLQLTGA